MVGVGALLGDWAVGWAIVDEEVEDLDRRKRLLFSGDGKARGGIDEVLDEDGTGTGTCAGGGLRGLTGSVLMVLAGSRPERTTASILDFESETTTGSGLVWTTAGASLLEEGTG